MSDYYDYDDDDYRPRETRWEDEWGCRCPAECIMPFPHSNGECVTAEEMEAMEREAFEAIVGIISARDAGFSDEEVQAAQSHFQFRDGEDFEEFQRFATQCAGLTFRESLACYWKHEFWCHRQGLITYPDE